MCPTRLHCPSTSPLTACSHFLARLVHTFVRLSASQLGQEQNGLACLSFAVLALNHFRYLKTCSAGICFKQHKTGARVGGRCGDQLATHPVGIEEVCLICLCFCLPVCRVSLLLSWIILQIRLGKSTLHTTSLHVFD